MIQASVNQQSFQQEVNLYRLLPKKTGMYLTRGVVLGLYLGFFLLLMLFYFFVSMRANHLEVSLTQTTQAYTAVESELIQLNLQYPVSDPAHLQDSLKAEQDQLQLLNTEINLLSFNAIFSVYLEGIAKATVIGVWLKELDFNRDESNIVLKGFVVQQVLLEQFLANLSRQTRLNHLVFVLQDFTGTAAPASFTLASKQMDAL